MHVQLVPQEITMQVVHGIRFDEVLRCTTAYMIHPVPKHAQYLYADNSSI